ncbi:hypothetical protein GDO78_006778 [Eleutherodactylus coqui]|uniref:Uncharacterized protein n=1 Tax=Eleutherodactylus coqui TaxID=57060 RepID=A0A8J6FFV6_ELECQ|nr:hypothetical protein GDO78_006778 [Eleutherodactylus coqui]
MNNMKKAWSIRFWSTNYQERKYFAWLTCSLNISDSEWSLIPKCHNNLFMLFHSSECASSGDPHNLGIRLTSMTEEGVKAKEAAKISILRMSLSIRDPRRTRGGLCLLASWIA